MSSAPTALRPARPSSISNWSSWSATGAIASTRSQLTRFCDHYLRLLLAAIDRPSSALHALPLLGDAERQTVVVDWNRTHVDYPKRSVPECIAAQMRSVPDAPALIAGDQMLTYRQLDQLVEHFAQLLRGLGVRAGQIVGLCVQRGVRAVAMLLAVHRIGAAYLPLDPDYPSDWFDSIVRDSGMALLVVDARSRARAQAAPRALDIDAAELPAGQGAPV
jgi:non-ribosomal peptide synthetase component F